MLISGSRQRKSCSSQKIVKEYYNNMMHKAYNEPHFWIIKIERIKDRTDRKILICEVFLSYNFKVVDRDFAMVAEETY